MLHEVSIPTFSHVDIHALDDRAAALLKEFGGCTVWVFTGEMGAGKTTLIKAFCRALRVTDTLSSPTFSIVNEYRTAKDTPVYHFDFYRLKREQEAVDIGVEEYLYSGQYCFIEWHERIPSLLPEEYIEIRILPEDVNHRTLELVLHGRKEEKRI